MQIQTSVDAIVISKKKLLANDLSVKLITSQGILLSVIAKGVNVITSRRRSVLDSANYIHCLIKTHGSFHALQEASLVSAFSAVKNNIQKSSILYLWLFIVNNVLYEESEDEEMFTLLLTSIKSLSKYSGNNLQEIHILFMNSIASKLGIIHEFQNIQNITKTLEEVMQKKLPDLLIK